MVLGYPYLWKPPYIEWFRIWVPKGTIFRTTPRLSRLCASAHGGSTAFRNALLACLGNALWSGLGWTGWNHVILISKDSDFVFFLTLQCVVCIYYVYIWAGSPETHTAPPPFSPREAQLPAIYSIWDAQPPTCTLLAAVENHNLVTGPYLAVYFYPCCL